MFKVKQSSWESSDIFRLYDKISDRYYLLNNSSGCGQYKNGVRYDIHNGYSLYDNHDFHEGYEDLFNEIYNSPEEIKDLLHQQLNINVVINKIIESRLCFSLGDCYATLEFRITQSWEDCKEFSVIQIGYYVTKLGLVSSIEEGQLLVSNYLNKELSKHFEYSQSRF